MQTRSVLFTPGDKSAMIRKSLQLDVDVVIIDLEDAVSPSDKDRARDTVAATFADVNDPVPQVWIRINPYEAGGKRDIEAIDSIASTPTSIVLPMVDSESDVRELKSVLDAKGIDASIVGILETALGITQVETIVDAEGLGAVVFGSEDFTADMGIIQLNDRQYLDYARSRIAVAAASADVRAIDTVYTNIEDTAGLRRDAERARNFGFDGKIAIHPIQTDIIEDVFKPSDDDIEWAKTILSATSDADSGVFEVDGQMIDAPVIARAEEIMSRTDERLES